MIRRLSARRLAAAAALLLPLACGETGTGPPGGGGGGGSASVTVSPSSAHLTAVGATHDFSGSGTDAGGQSLSEGDLSWSSTDPSVATVDGSGVATAEGNGSARIVASFGEAADTAEVTVEQEAAAVIVSPDSASVDAAGDTVHFSAAAEDANGNPVQGAAPTWSSTDTTVATVDASGVATARDSGSVRIVATAASGAADSAVLVVEINTSGGGGGGGAGGGGSGGSGGAPSIDTVSPDTLEEGAGATVTGEDFSATASENVVLVDGVQATVTAASTTELQVTVPQFDCRPLRAADVRVVVAGDSSAPAGITVRPDEASVSLAPGERAVIHEPGDDLCLQFDASASDQEYLVGVQSVASSVGPTSVVLTSETGAAGSGSSTPAAVPPAAARAPWTTRTTPPAGELRGAGPEEAWERHYRNERRIRGWEARRLPEMREHVVDGEGATDGPGDPGDPGDGPPVALSHGSGGGGSVSGSVAEGDTVELRVPDIDAGDLCAAYDSIQGVVRTIGDHGIWIEDVANPSSGYSAGDWTDLSDTFDGFVYDTDTDYFGAPTDADSNGRVVMVVTKAVNEAGGILGFVFGGDLISRSSCASSDEGEFTYLLAPDPDGTHGPAWTVADLKEDNPRLVAHEFTHMIQFGTRLNCSACSFMPSFVSEGQAVVAEEVNGHAETGRSPGNDYGDDVAWDDDSSDPRKWYDNRFIDMARYYGWGGGYSGPDHHDSAPEDCSWLTGDWAGICDGVRGVYGVPSSIMRWMADHFGPGYPGGEQGFFRDMTASTETGFANWESLTGLTVKEILAYWGPMLWTDGRIGVADAMMTLPSWDLFSIFQSRIQDARLQPSTRGFVGFVDSFGVNAGSAAYYLVGATSRPHVSLKARAPGGGVLAAHMQMWVVRTR